MRLMIVGLFLLSLLSTQNTFAGTIREIDLTDGSTISGEVLSLTNGVYTIKSDSLGTVKLDESKIRAIRSKSSPPASVGGTAADIQTMQSKMLSDKEIMTLIQSLQNDPDFKKVLEDPEIMKAINEGNIPMLTANPKFMQLLNNATVKDIEKKVQ